MGFYLRKSVSVGPFRFNLSKSGIGISAGVRGLRFGTGPRGNYVHMGRGGLYYRATLPASPSSTPESVNQPNYGDKSSPPIPSGTHDPLSEIESADVSKIVDSSSRELLEEISQKQKKMRIWPWVAFSTVVLVVMGVIADWPIWLLGSFLVAGAIGTYAAHARDVLQKTVVLFYDFDSEMEDAYGGLHSAAAKLAECSAAWHIEAAGKVHDSKYHAGASSLISRKPTVIRKSEPSFLKTNIETISMGVGRQTLHFFPDRVLIYDANGVGAVGYKELNIEVRDSRFIEDGSVPRDAQVVDKTWKYVNKKGGPDKRFKDNRELPICMYEEIHLTSSTGLNEVIQVSKNGLGGKFSQAITSLGTKIS